MRARAAAFVRALRADSFRYTEKLPKRGFTNHFSKEYAIINLNRLEELFDDGSVVDIETLLAEGALRKELDGLKVLGEGELTKKLTVKGGGLFRERKGEDRSRRREGRGGLKCWKH